MSFRNAINAGNKWPTGNSEKYYILTRDIVLEYQSNWVGVGTSSNSFIGVFLGNNQTISGSLSCSSYNCGIFGYTGSQGSDYAVIKDLVSSVNVSSSYDYVGGVVGNGNATDLINVRSSGTISGKSYVGGIAGCDVPAQTVKNCTSSSTITATGENVGGIVGYIAGYTIQNCSYSGTLTAKGGKAGGIVGFGESGGSIRNSHTSGSIKGSSSGNYYGGIIGDGVTGDMENCDSTSNISTGKTCGGLIGIGASYKVSTSYYNGTLNCSVNSGGVIGEAGNSVQVLSSGAFGNITGNTAGGLVGYIGKTTSAVTINNNFAVTALTGDVLGGLVGYSEATSNYGSNIDCNWVGSVFKSGTPKTAAVCYGEKSFNQNKPVFVYKPTYSSASNQNFVPSNSSSSTFSLSNNTPVINSTPMLNALSTACSDGNWKAHNCTISYGLAGSDTYTLPLPGITPSNCK